MVEGVVAVVKVCGGVVAGKVWQVWQVCAKPPTNHHPSLSGGEVVGW